MQRQSQPLVVLALPFLLCCVFTLSIPGAERRRGDTAGGLRGSGCWELTKERPRSGGCDADHMLRPLLNRERGPTCIFVCTCVCMLASPHRLHHACIMLVSQGWFHHTHTHTHTHTHEDLVNVAAGIAEKHALALHLLTQKCCVSLSFSLSLSLPVSFSLSPSLSHTPHSCTSLFLPSSLSLFLPHPLSLTLPPSLPLCACVRVYEHEERDLVLVLHSRFKSPRAVPGHSL